MIDTPHSHTPPAAVAEEPPRTLPVLTDENRRFWTGGASGQLLIAQCQTCHYLIHPASPRCPRCLGADIAATAVSGRATVSTYTVNHHRWLPGLRTPYVIALVELVEQAGLRLPTNLINCSPREITIGMPVCVVFEQHEDVYLPMFEPERAR